MSTAYEISSFEALQAEQAAVQAEKFQGRLISQYDNNFFPGQSWLEPLGSTVTDLVRPVTGDCERISLEAILNGMSEAKAGQTVSWVDMGGGRAMSMRQLAVKQGEPHNIHMTNVDLFAYGIDGLETNEIKYLERMAPGITEPGTEPDIILDNAETVRLPEPADLITSVELIQYLNNPLEAIANWYNQLADNGIMLITAGHEWASWIRYDGEDINSEQYEAPTKHLLDELSAAGINFAASNASDWENGYRPKLDPNEFRILAIQKLAGTDLKVNRQVTAIWVSPNNYKAVYYEVPNDGLSPIVGVVKPETNNCLGAIALVNTK